MPTDFPSTLEFRSAIDADGAGISAVIERIFGDYENCPFIADEFPELRAPATHYAKKGGQLWTIEEKQPDQTRVIVGSIAVAATYREGVFELFKFYLAHHLRGQEIARLMLEQAFSFARQAEAGSMELWTDTRFKSGHRFYEKHGFVRIPGMRALHDSADTLEFGYRIGLADRPDR